MAAVKLFPAEDAAVQLPVNENTSSKNVMVPVPLVCVSVCVPV